MNGGKLKSSKKENYYRPSVCMDDLICNQLYGKNSTCKKDNPSLNLFGQCT